MEPEALNKFMLKVKPTYDFVVPDFDEWLESGALDSQSVDLLKHLAEMSSIDQCEYFKSNDLISKVLLNATYATGPGLLRCYALERLCDICRVDNSVYSKMLEILHDRDVFEIYYDIATHGKDPKITDKALFLLSGLVVAGNGRFTHNQVETLLQAIERAAISDVSKLYAIANVLEAEQYRDLAFLRNGTKEIMKRSLQGEAHPNAQYKAVYCLWLLTRVEANVQLLYQENYLHAFFNLFCSTKIEKIVRVCLLVLKHLFNDPKCLELMVDKNVAQTLTLLEYDKWRDVELYDDIHNTHVILEGKTCKLSNFERYCCELDSGVLKWSILHSEKFWVAHHERFEQDEFKNIGKLVKLLYNSQDPTTVAVACFDLGEFARLYHNGKKICQRFRVKDKVMELISNKDREIARAAMLCAQKLMLQNWRSVKPANGLTTLKSNITGAGLA